MKCVYVCKTYKHSAWHKVNAKYVGAITVVWDTHQANNRFFPDLSLYVGNLCQVILFSFVTSDTLQKIRPN